MILKARASAIPADIESFDSKPKRIAEKDGATRTMRLTYSLTPPPMYSHEKMNEPRKAPMKIQIIMYPLKYIASNITKYATANCSMCSSARITCSMRLGRTRKDAAEPGPEAAAGAVEVLAGVFWAPVPLLPMPIALSDSEAGDGVAAPGWVCAEGARY